ncbi:peptidoglycan-binding protein [Streptomyces lydicus]|uniref:peptidoglycan-binding protein n=1 Tax=Streptomyces lydicus TaxID=47763 RepID=UPI00379CCAE9
MHTAAIATPKHTSSASAAPHTSTTTPPSGIGTPRTSTTPPSGIGTPRTEEPAGGGSSGSGGSDSDSDRGANGGVPAPAPCGGPGPGSAESTASGGPRPTGGTGGKGGAPSRPGAVGGTDGSTPPAPKPWSSCNYYSGDALTQYGDSGDRVVEVQCILKARGYNIGPTGVDGKFGDATRGAVKQFQRAHHLRVDGQVGEHTWRALRS